MIRQQIALRITHRLFECPLEDLTKSADQAGVPAGHARLVCTRCQAECIVPTVEHAIKEMSP
jgi:hypothetical protein